MTNFIESTELISGGLCSWIRLLDSILEEMKEIIPYLKSSTDRIDRILASVHLERAQLIFFLFFFNVWLWLNLRGILLWMLSQGLKWKNIARCSGHSQWFSEPGNVLLDLNLSGILLWKLSQVLTWKNIARFKNHWESPSLLYSIWNPK